MDFLLLLAVFLAVSAVITLLVKRFTSHDTYLVFSLIKSGKPLGFFNSMARHKKFIDAFSSLGLILGFGAFAADFLYGKKMPKKRRIALFVFSFLCLSSFLVLVDLAFGNIFSNNPLIGASYPLLVVSFGLMGLGGFTLFSLFLQAFDIVSKYLLGIGACPGVAPLIPGVEIPGVPITPPLHAWLSLFIILLAHEGMHGITGRRHGFKIRSAGVILLGFLPIGAFVEPDEEELKRSEPKKLASFLASGPMANICLMALASLVLFAGLSIAMPVTEALYPGIQENYYSGVVIDGVLESTEHCGESYPAPAFGVFGEGDVIEKINGTEITGINSLYSALGETDGRETQFVLLRDGSEVDVSLVPNELGQFGFYPKGIPNPNLEIPWSYEFYALALSLAVDFLYWLALLNFLVAAINFLPMHPFDGGRIAKAIFSPYLVSKKRSEKRAQELVSKFFLVIILGLFAVNALPLFI